VLVPHEHTRTGLEFLDAVAALGDVGLLLAFRELRELRDRRSDHEHGRELEDRFAVLRELAGVSVRYTAGNGVGAVRELPQAERAADGGLLGLRFGFHGSTYLSMSCWVRGR